jgi:hypothetical protein
LDQVSIGKLFALQTVQHQKAMDQPLGVTHTNLFRRQTAGLEQRGTGQQYGNRLAPDTLVRSTRTSLQRLQAQHSYAFIENHSGAFFRLELPWVCS